MGKIIKATDLTDEQRESLCRIYQSKNEMYYCPDCPFYETVYSGGHKPYCRLVGGADGWGQDEAMLVDMDEKEPVN